VEEMKKRLPGETWSSQEDRHWDPDDHPIIKALLSIVGVLVSIAALYGLIRFVKWAWN
jgi:hypothetical protein